jgi:hypothetical protein
LRPVLSDMWNGPAKQRAALLEMTGDAKSMDELLHRGAAEIVSAVLLLLEPSSR